MFGDDLVTSIELADRTDIKCHGCGFIESVSFGPQDDYDDHLCFVWDRVRQLMPNHRIGVCVQECAYCDGLEKQDEPHFRVTLGSTSGSIVGYLADATSFNVWQGEECVFTLTRETADGQWSLDSGLVYFSDEVWMDREYDDPYSLISIYRNGMPFLVCDDGVNSF